MRYQKLALEEQNYFSMHAYGYVLPSLDFVRKIAWRAGPLTVKATQRLRIVDWHFQHGKNVSLTARRFGIQRKTLRRWLKRMKQEGLRGLCDRSSRPHELRKPQTHPSVVKAILELRQARPFWSKYKLHTVLKRHGVVVSASTIGRTLKRYGFISEKVSRKHRKAALHPKKRYPRGLVIRRPGDLVQIDTKHAGYIGGAKSYQFTAIDVLTRLRVLESSPSLSSRHAAKFFQVCQREFPFPIRAVQHDNGSEFRGAFEKQLAQLGITQYFTHVRSPKENSYVERSHRTDKEEFYGQYIHDTFPQRQRALKRWQVSYNTERPHQALDQRTPFEYFLSCSNRRIANKDCVILQL